MTSWSNATSFAGCDIDQFIRRTVYSRNPSRVNVATGGSVGADWLDALEEAGGLLVPAARTFVESQRDPMPGNGTTGVRWLADLVEHFIDDEAGATDDHRFVEGAGAFLGLLLIDHLGGCTREHEGCHRLQLGRFGSFDPFRAIEEVLNAEDPRLRLSEYLAVAEREADEDGPISRVVRVFADMLDRERPDLQIESQFELSVDLNNGASVDLARLERVAQDQDDRAAAEAARRIISMLPDDAAQNEIRWAEAAARILPRLVSEQFLTTLPNEEALFCQVLGHDVQLALQLRYGARARYVRRTEVEAWAAENASATVRAIENLAVRSRELRLEPMEERLFRVRQGDGLDGARLVLPDLAARLAGVERGSWIAAAPHRDCLLLTPEHRQGARKLAERANDAAQRAPHPISAALFAVTAAGLRPIGR